MITEVTIPSLLDDSPPFIVKIDCPASTLHKVRLRLAVSKAIADGRNLTNLDFSNLDLSGIRFDGVDLSNTSFYKCNLTGVQMVDCNVSNTNFSHANFIDAFLDHIYGTGVDCTATYFTGSSMRWVRLVFSEFSSARLDKVNLEGSSLKHSDFHYTDFSGANITDVDWLSANICTANFENAVIQDTKIRSVVAHLTRWRAPVYQFTAFRLMDSDEVMIKAGCQWRTLSSYRDHVHSYSNPDKVEETTAILDFIQARAKACK